MPSIELKDLTKTYPLRLSDAARSVLDIVLGREGSVTSRNTKVAVDRVSLGIGTGERVGIVGRNGAGKSTLLHMIAGIAAPTSGTIRVDGHVSSVLTLGIGLREELTGRENVRLDGELQGKTGGEVAALMDEIAAFADLGEFMDRPIRTYSTGMKARLAFAMIAHIDPEILLIDEALSAGDAEFSAKATRRIREICNKGKIVVVVSHALEAINGICNRCLWMESGRVVMDGRPEDVTKAYAKSVHDRDDGELLERFRRHIGGESFVTGDEIRELVLSEEGVGIAKSTFRAEKAIVVRIEATTGAQGPAVFRLLVERLDGLLLADEAFTCGEPKARAGAAQELTATAILQPAIGPGTYKIVVELSISGKLAARRTSVFAVVAKNPPTGGRAALHYPYSIESAAVP